MIHQNPIINALLEGMINPALPSIELSLGRMKALMKALGNPERTLPPVIHFAGTNGKGSTLSFLRAIYQAAGYRVHAYTSPHLVRFNERIVLANHEISDDGLLDVLTRVAAVPDAPVTYFEATTAAAFLAFSEHEADVVLLETGMGGRLDATNIIDAPLASVITPVDYDHMEFLGNTLGAIAGEKAGIMKPRVPCFVGAQKPEAREVIKRAARVSESPLHIHGFDWSYESDAKGIEVMSGTSRWRLPLPALSGVHQHHNAALASVVVQSIKTLPVTLDAMNKGIASANWPARLQRLSSGPLVDAWSERGEVYLDGGHNPSAAIVAAAWMASQNVPITFICGMMKRKDAKAFLSYLLPHAACFIAVPIADNDCYNPHDLAEIAQSLGMSNAMAVDSLSALPNALEQEKSGTLLIVGSLFLAGEVLKNHS